jgi:hypothetical protein
MGRRARARERAAAAAAAEATPSTTTPTTTPRQQPLRKLLRWLNPIKPRSGARARFAAVAFGVLALMIAGAAWANGRPALYRPAVLLAILSVLWGVRAAFMPEDPER